MHLAAVTAACLELSAACVQKDEGRIRISFEIGSRGMVGAFVFLWAGVGLGLLHVVGGINVALRWGCVQGVWAQCRRGSLGMGSRVSNVGWDYKNCSSKL